MKINNINLKQQLYKRNKILTNKIFCYFKVSDDHWYSSRMNMSRLMGKPTICIDKNKDADQLRGNREISAFVFATRIVQFLFYLNPKFQAASSFLCLYRPVCVGPVRKPHCWFSHEVAKMSICRSISFHIHSLYS